MSAARAHGLGMNDCCKHEWRSLVQMGEKTRHVRPDGEPCKSLVRGSTQKEEEAGQGGFVMNELLQKSFGLELAKNRGEGLVDKG